MNLFTFCYIYLIFKVRGSLKQFIPLLFRHSLYWWLSCGGHGSFTPTHDDPLGVSRGFLAVVKGMKAVLFWSKSKGDQGKG